MTHCYDKGTTMLKEMQKDHKHGFPATAEMKEIRANDDVILSERITIMSSEIFT